MNLPAFASVCVCVFVFSWHHHEVLSPYTSKDTPSEVRPWESWTSNETSKARGICTGNSWSIQLSCKFPPPQKKWLMWSLATICQPCRCGVGSDNLLAWNRWKGTIWNNYWNNYTWHVTFMGSSGHASWNIFCFKSPCLWGGKMCLMDDFWNEILNEDPNIIPQLSTTSCI